MIKKGWFVGLVIAIICVVFAVSGTIVYAQDKLDGPMRKVSRGLLNTFLSPLEIFQTMTEVGRDEGIMAGGTYGLLKGITYFFCRAGIGIYEVLTFPIPVPENYEPILKNPEFYPGEGKGLE